MEDVSPGESISSASKFTHMIRAQQDRKMWTLSNGWKTENLTHRLQRGYTTHFALRESEQIEILPNDLTLRYQTL